MIEMFYSRQVPSMDEIKQFVRPMLIKATGNSFELLKVLDAEDAAYTIFHDMAVIYGIPQYHPYVINGCVFELNTRTVTMDYMITNQILTAMGLDVAGIHKIAVDNLKNDDYRVVASGNDEEYHGFQIADDDTFKLIMSSKSTLGSSVLLSPDILSQLVNKSCYVFTQSYNGVVVLEDTDMITKDDMKRMIAMCAECDDPERILTLNLFYFDKEANTLTVI